MRSTLKERKAINMLARIKRHDELIEAHVKFESDHGRHPTARELWEISPPKEEK